MKDRFEGPGTPEGTSSLLETETKSSGPVYLTTEELLNQLKEKITQLQAIKCKELFSDDEELLTIATSLFSNVEILINKIVDVTFPHLAIEHRKKYIDSIYQKYTHIAETVLEACTALTASKENNVEAKYNVVLAVTKFVHALVFNRLDSIDYAAKNFANGAVDLDKFPTIVAASQFAEKTSNFKRVGNCIEHINKSAEILKKIEKFQSSHMFGINLFMAALKNMAAILNEIILKLDEIDRLELDSIDNSQAQFYSPEAQKIQEFNYYYQLINFFITHDGQPNNNPGCRSMIEYLADPCVTIDKKMVQLNLYKELLSKILFHRGIEGSDPAKDIFAKLNRDNKILDLIDQLEASKTATELRNFLLSDDDLTMPRWRDRFNFVFSNDPNRKLWQEILLLPKFNGPLGLDITKGIGYGIFLLAGGLPLILARTLIKATVEFGALSLQKLLDHGIEIIHNHQGEESNYSTSNMVSTAIGIGLIGMRAFAATILGILSYAAKGVRVTSRIITAPVRSAQEGYQAGMYFESPALAWTLASVSALLSLGVYTAGAVALALFALPAVINSGIAYAPEIGKAILFGLNYIGTPIAKLLGLNSTFAIGPVVMNTALTIGSAIVGLAVPVLSTVKSVTSKLSDKLSSWWKKRALKKPEVKDESFENDGQGRNPGNQKRISTTIGENNGPSNKERRLSTSTIIDTLDKAVLEETNDEIPLVPRRLRAQREAIGNKHIHILVKELPTPQASEDDEEPLIARRLRTLR